MIRIVVVTVLSLCAVLVAPSATAASANPPRVAIEGFRGPQAERIQGAVETGLLGRYYVVPDFSVEEAARSSGVELLIDSEFARVGKALDVRAFVSAEIARHRLSGWQVRLLVRRGDTGAPVGRILVADRRLDRLERELSQRTSRRLEALLSRAPAAGEIDPPPLASADASVAADSEIPPALRPAGQDRGPRLLQVTLDGRMFSRSFAYTQNLSGLPEYQISRALATSLEVALHPAAGSDLPAFYAPIGLLASLEYGLGVGSRVNESEERRASDVHGYAVGMEYRLISASAAFELAPQVSYAVRAFTTGEPDAQAPDVRYQLVSAGLGARAELAHGLHALGRAGYLYVLSAGPLTEASRFSRAKVTGLEAEGSLGYALMRGLEMRASVGLRRFGYDMDARPGDAWVAGGAIDQTVWGGLGLVYRPGPSSSTSARSSATPALAARR